MIIKGFIYMSDNRNIKQFLPAPFRNDKVDNFLDTTTETLFTKKESTKINQFIGKTVGGIYEPLKDNYVNEIRKIRRLPIRTFSSDT